MDCVCLYPFVLMQLSGQCYNCRPLLACVQIDIAPEEYTDCLLDGELLGIPVLVEDRSLGEMGAAVPLPLPLLDFNDNEDIPTELSDSSETHDEGMPLTHTHTDTHIHIYTHTHTHTYIHTHTHTTDI